MRPEQMRDIGVRDVRGKAGGVFGRDAQVLVSSRDCVLHAR
jgi:hypothetical protein